MKLNDLIAEFHEIEDLIIDGGGEVTPELEVMLNVNSEALNDKLDKYENLKRYLKGQIEYLKSQEAHYKKRRNTLANTIKWLSENQTYALKQTENQKLKTDEYNYSIRKSEKVIIDEKNISSEWDKKLIYRDMAEVIVKYDKAEIKKHFKDEAELPNWLKFEEKWSVTAR